MRAPHPWLGHERLQRKSRLDFLGPVFFLLAWFGALCMLGASQLTLKSSLSSARRSKVSTRVRRTPSVNVSFAVGTTLWTVPADVTSLLVDIAGGAGGNTPDGSIGGKGGRVQATLPVTPGETLQIGVGGGAQTVVTGPMGGHNGGGNAWNRGGIGGGATDIRKIRGRYTLGSSSGFRATNTTQTPTGDQDWRVKVDLNSYAPASEQDLLSKFPATGADTASFLFAIKATGKLRAWWHESGGTDRDVESTVTLGSVGIVPGIPVRLRTTVTMSTGTVKFWYSINDGATWVQLGADVVVGASNMATSTAKLCAGNYDGFAGGISGKLYEASMHSSIGGAVLAEFKAESASAGAYTAPSGETWTPVGAPAYSTGAADRFLVAGGGGGAGSNGSTGNGGDGGGTTAVAGSNGSGTTAGGAGTPSAGGAAGTGSSPTAGSLGQGGNAGNDNNAGRCGGGGGGGLYGGGGGGTGGSGTAGSGGGGGSSYAAASATGVVHTQGYRSGVGYAMLTFLSAAYAAPTTPLSDDFSELDGTLLNGKQTDSSHVWQSVLGVQAVSGGFAAATSTPGAPNYHAVSIVPNQPSDGELSFTVGALPANGYGYGVVYRYKDPNNYRFVFMNKASGGTPGLYSGRVEAGTNYYDHFGAPLSSLTVGDVFKIRFVGTTLRLYQNNVELGVAQSTFNQTETGLGVLHSDVGGGLDNIQFNPTVPAEVSGSTRPYLDTFNRTARPTAPRLGLSDSGHTYIDLRGVVTTDGVSRATGTTDENVSVVETNFSDGYAEFVLGSTLPIGQNVGIAYRATDANNFRFFFLNRGSDGTVAIYSGKYQAGVASYDLQSGVAIPVAQAVGQVYRIEFIGNSIRTLQNGVQIGSVGTSSFNQTATKHGPWVGGTNDCMTTLRSAMSSSAFLISEDFSGVTGTVISSGSDDVGAAYAVIGAPTIQANKARLAASEQIYWEPMVLPPKWLFRVKGNNSSASNAFNVGIMYGPASYFYLYGASWNGDFQLRRVMGSDVPVIATSDWPGGSGSEHLVELLFDNWTFTLYLDGVSKGSFTVPSGDRANFTGHRFGLWNGGGGTSNDFDFVTLEPVA